MKPTPLALSQLKASDLERPGVHFTHDGWHYSTSGKVLGQGGTGIARLATRWPANESTAPTETVVVKTFRDELLILLREDERARRHFEHSLAVMDRLSQLHDSHIIPILLSSPIADNHVIVTPLAGESLVSLLASQSLSPRERTGLLIDAIRGLAVLHAEGICHRDFTLNNILTLGQPIGPGMSRHAALFDFDLTVWPLLLTDAERSYAGCYGGTVAGSPEYSVAPELLDEVLSLEPISPRIDVYAIGTALYAMFSAQSLYGEQPDLASLLVRISEGVVCQGRSSIRYPDDVPVELRPIIDTCLERNPQDRYTDAAAVLPHLEEVALGLSAAEGQARYKVTLSYAHASVKPRLDVVLAERTDPTITVSDLRLVDDTLTRYGYVLIRSLGRVKGHPIYLAQPDPKLVAVGQFPDANLYPKIVTAIDVGHRADGQAFVENWLGRIRPIVSRIRQGFLTPLYKAVHDRPSGQLLLFSEYVADARFGNDLEQEEISLEEAFALGLTLCHQVARLHGEGLAHNNVRPESLLFRGERDAGQARALLVGLVEPTFDPAAREDDVRSLAGMVAAWIEPARIAMLRADMQPAIVLLREDLLALSRGDLETPVVGTLAEMLAAALGALDHNFEVVRAHGGDALAYADLLVRYSLYARLFSVPQPADEG